MQLIKLRLETKKSNFTSMIARSIWNPSSRLLSMLKTWKASSNSSFRDCRSMTKAWMNWTGNSFHVWCKSTSKFHCPLRWVFNIFKYDMFTEIKKALQPMLTRLRNWSVSARSLRTKQRSRKPLCLIWMLGSSLQSSTLVLITRQRASNCMIVSYKSAPLICLLLNIFAFWKD